MKKKMQSKIGRPLYVCLHLSLSLHSLTLSLQADLKATIADILRKHQTQTKGSWGANSEVFWNTKLTEQAKANFNNDVEQFKQQVRTIVLHVCVRAYDPDFLGLC